MLHVHTHHSVQMPFCKQWSNFGGGNFKWSSKAGRGAWFFLHPPFHHPNCPTPVASPQCGPKGMWFKRARRWNYSGSGSHRVMLVFPSLKNIGSWFIPSPITGLSSLILSTVTEMDLPRSSRPHMWVGEILHAHPLNDGCWVLENYRNSEMQFEMFCIEISWVGVFYLRVRYTWIRLLSLYKSQSLEKIWGSLNWASMSSWDLERFGLGSNILRS